MIKILTPFAALLLLTGCQTTQSKTEVPIDIPIEQTHIILPDGDLGPLIKVTRNVDFEGFVKEVINYENGYFRYLTLKNGKVIPRGRSEILTIFHTGFRVFNGTPLTPDRPLNTPNLGPGTYLINAYNNLICLASMSNPGTPETIDSVIHYPGEILIGYCQPGKSLADNPNFERDALAFLSKIKIRED